MRYKHILNIGIMAHVDAGKTSLTERLLYNHGTINKLGSVDSGNTQTDSSQLEQQRKITIRAAVASFVYKDLQVNIIDTPGHPDFIAEVERTLSVMDGAILVLSAVEGIQPQTRVLVKTLKKLHFPTIVFINKIDRRGAHSESLTKAIKRVLWPNVIPMNSITNCGSSNVTVNSDLLENSGYRNGISEILANNDDYILEKLSENKRPSKNEIIASIKRQTSCGFVQPLFFGSAILGKGILALTDGIKMFLSPHSSSNESLLRGTVFAIERNRLSEKSAYVRLFSGELRERQPILLYRRDKNGVINQIKEKVTSLEVAGNQIPSLPKEVRLHQNLTANNIGKLRGMDNIQVGDQLDENDLRNAILRFSPPNLEAIIRPKNPKEGHKLHNALTCLVEEDPLIHARLVPDGGMALMLYGEVQKEVIVNRLHYEFNVEAIFDPITPVYFERPVGVGEAYEEMNFRGGPILFFATIGLRVEPAGFGEGVTYAQKGHLGRLPLAFHRAIESTIFKTLKQGLWGWEVTDCVVTLTASGYISSASTAADFRNLTPLVLMSALQSAGTELYEPYLDFEVEIPENVSNSIVTRLSKLRAEIISIEETHGSCLIKGGIPAKLAQDFIQTLPRLSGGTGVWWSQPGQDQLYQGPYPFQDRSDGNPLNRDEYLLHLSRRASGV